MDQERVGRPELPRADLNPASTNSLNPNDAFGITINHKTNKPIKLFPLSVSHSKPKIQTPSLYKRLFYSLLSLFRINIHLKLRTA